MSTKYTDHYKNKKFETHDQTPTIFKDPNPSEKEKRATDLENVIQDAKDKINER